MSAETPNPPSAAPSAATPAANTSAKPPALQPHPLPHLGEVFGTARRNLPPAEIVAIVLGAALVVLGVFAFVQRAKPQGGGSIDNVAAVEVPDQNMMMVAVTVTLRNSGEKPFWIHTINGKLKTDSDEFSDEGASGVDFNRYFQAFPALKVGALPPLLPETKIAPGAEGRGTVIVTFPVKQDDFDKRKSLSVVIQPYDQALPIVLTK